MKGAGVYSPYVSTYAASQRFLDVIAPPPAPASQRNHSVPAAGAVSIIPVSAAAAAAATSVAPPYEPMKQSAQYRAAMARPAPGAATTTSTGPRSAAESDALRARYATDNS